MGLYASNTVLLTTANVTQDVVRQILAPTPLPPWDFMPTDCDSIPPASPSSHHSPP